MFLCSLCLSCSHKLLPTVAQKDSTVAVKTDSIYVRDSVYIDRFNIIREKGDTVFVIQKSVEYRDRWREKVVRDTLRTTQKETVTQYVEKKLTWWQELQIWAGRILLVIVAGLVVYAGIKIFAR